MDNKLYTLTDEELKNLRDNIETEIFNRRNKKKKLLIEAFEKAWKDIENAGLEICLDCDDNVIHFDDIYIN